MSRDQILRAVNRRGFKFRHDFYALLDLAAHKVAAGGEHVKVAWPAALGVISLKDWQRAYRLAERGAAICPDCGRSPCIRAYYCNADNASPVQP